MSDITSNIVAQAAALDPTIRARVIALGDLALSEAEHLMRHGDPRMKQTIIRTILTSLGPHLRQREVNEELEELKSALNQLKADVLGYTPGDKQVDDTGSIIEDKPA